ncbi:MAG: UbiA family prenyltransferase [Balneolaceae bacterium]
MKTWAFILHLRMHYQLFILSGGYLLGGLLTEAPDWRQFLLQFLNVHLLLFGGATAFNSYWDKDEGPVGGLRHPPAMERWMRDASILIQLAGLGWAVTAGAYFTAVYIISLILFWLYSTPLARWKGRPLLSMAAIGISTGLNSLLMGALAAGAEWNGLLVIAGSGTTLILLSLYPVSQIFQMKADRNRGDSTFALIYGLRGIRFFFQGTFLPGVILITFSLDHSSRMPAILFLTAGTVLWVLLSFRIYRLKGEESEYRAVMKIKYVASLSFVTFIVISLLLKHA